MRTSEKPEATTAGTRSNYWLFSIILLAALVRFYALGALPPSLFIDEVWSSFGPQVFYGSADPVEWPLPMTMSQIVTGQLVTYELAGDSAFWTRSSTAGLGVVGIVLTFVLVNHWLGRRFALLTALAMAIAPWAIHLSRYAVPAMAYMVSLLALLILLEKFLARGSPVYLTGSVLAALAVLSSHAAARVFLPLFLTAYLFTRRTEAGRAVRGLAPQAVLAGFVLATYLAVQLYFVFVYDSPASAIQASLLSYFAFRDGIDLQAILGVILRYLQHWSPQFLIFQGDPNVKYSTGVVGQLGLLGLFSYLGLYWVVQNRRHPAARTFIWWAILWPLPSVLIVPDNPNAVRGISGLPLLLILATGGLYVAARSLRGHLQTRSSWIVPALTIILCQGAFSIWAYFFAWAANPRLPDAFDYGYRQAADVLLQLPPKPVIVSDRWRAQDLLAFHGLDAVSVESIPSQEALGDDQFARRTKYLLTSDPSELANLRRVGHGVTVIQEIRTPQGDTRMWLARVHPHA